MNTKVLKRVVQIEQDRWYIEILKYYKCFPLNYQSNVADSLWVACVWKYCLNLLNRRTSYQIHSKTKFRCNIEIYAILTIFLEWSTYLYMLFLNSFEHLSLWCYRKIYLWKFNSIECVGVTVCIRIKLIWSTYFSLKSKF